MKTKLALLTVLVSAASYAAPLTFQFDTTIDTSPLGGAVATPLTVTYTFDPALMGPPDGGTYGPLSFLQLRLGNETVSGFELATIWVSDSPEGPDSYTIYATLPLTSVDFFGTTLRYFGISMEDPDGTMFSSGALPLSASFATAADFQQTLLQFDQESLAADPQTPFTLTVVPEPSTVVLLLAAATIAGVVWMRKRVQ